MGESDYVVGIDLGTTYTAAAVATGGHTQIFQLGTASASIPSVVLLRADGTVLVGESAAHRAVTEPTRAAREFKRRLGDSAPLILGGTPYSADNLLGHLLRDVLDRVSSERGRVPARVCLTHPANWGAYKLDLLHEAARVAELSRPLMVPEPQAAAIHYATDHELQPGEHLAVYDLGGGTFDAAVVQRTTGGFSLVGTPEGIERFGGIDLDQAVFSHVVATVGDALDALDHDDPATVEALANLRSACQRGKEALSADTDCTIPVLLPNLHTQVRMTRSEFEDLIRPRLRETLRVLERVVRSAQIRSQDLARTLLVGGSSRIPLVAELVREATGRPVGLDANPKHAVSLGAAALGAATYGSGGVHSIGGLDEPSAGRSQDPTARDERDTPKLGPDSPPPPPDDDRPVEVTGGPLVAPPRRRRPRLSHLAAAVLGSVLIAAVAGFALTRSGASPDPASASGAGDDGPPMAASGEGGPGPEDPAFPGFDLPLRAHSSWEFAFEVHETRMAQGEGSNSWTRSGRLRIVLGDPDSIEGLDAYPVHVLLIDGDPPGFGVPWTHLASNGNVLLGSDDGATLRPVFDAQRGVQPGGGFFAGFGTGVLLSANRGSSEALSGQDVVVLEHGAREGDKECETFADVGTVCVGDHSIDSDHREYFLPGVGPAGFESELRYSFDGGGFASGGEESISVALVDHALDGDGGAWEGAFLSAVGALEAIDPDLADPASILEAGYRYCTFLAGAPDGGGLAEQQLLEQLATSSEILYGGATSPFQMDLLLLIHATASEQLCPGAHDVAGRTALPPLLRLLLDPVVDLSTFDLTDPMLHETAGELCRLVAAIASDAATEEERYELGAGSLAALLQESPDATTRNFQAGLFWVASLTLCPQEHGSMHGGMSVLGIVAEISYDGSGFSTYLGQ